MDKADYIAEEMGVVVCRWQGKTIDVQVPKTVTVKVANTDPGAKGNTAQGRAEKPATLATGATINVPIFIEEGEEIKVDTEDGKYLTLVGFLTGMVHVYAVDDEGLLSQEPIFKYLYP